MKFITTFLQVSQVMSGIEQETGQVAQSVIQIISGIMVAVFLYLLVTTFTSSQGGDDRQKKLIGLGVGFLLFTILFFMAQQLADLITQN